MSRIIVERHPGGEEATVTGWDAPLGTCFLDFHDTEGEWIEHTSMGPLTGRRTPIHPEEIAHALSDHGYPLHIRRRVLDLLYEHAELEYPASNVVIDLSDPECHKVALSDAPDSAGSEGKH